MGGGYEIYYEQNENSKKWNSKDVHLFRNDPKLYEWLNKLYEICKKIYSNYQYGIKQYHLEIFPLYVKPITQQ